MKLLLFQQNLKKMAVAFGKALGALVSRYEKVLNTIYFFSNRWKNSCWKIQVDSGSGSASGSADIFDN